MEEDLDYVVKSTDERIQELLQPALRRNWWQHENLTWVQESELERLLDEVGKHPDCVCFEELATI